MSPVEIVAIAAIVLALAFDFVNGFHDTANAVATVIYTKALKPRVAIALSGVLNFLGAVMVGTAVAMVITKIIPRETASLTVVIAVLLGALTWNLLTWYRGLPVSSSHCLIGSLFGAGVAANGLNGVNWDELTKVLVALLLSPVCGFAAGALLTWTVLKIIAATGNSKLENAPVENSSATPAAKESKPPAAKKSKHERSEVLRWLQVLSSSSVSFTHGSNDGQKTMGIVTLILASQFAPHGYSFDHVPLWVAVASAAAIGLGTTIGGWRVIRTVGTKITREKITYAHGFGAEFSTAVIIYIASILGAPISTTHTLTSAVAGGTIPSHGFNKLNFKMIYLILAAWVFTLPAAALLSALSYWSLVALQKNFGGSTAIAGL